MKPIRYRVSASDVIHAEAALARYLPGLDVQLFEYEGGTALLPPHLQRALKLEYGEDDSLSILDNVGLRDGKPVPWREVLNWALVNAQVWDRHNESAPSSSATPATLDWHLSICGVDSAWKALGGPDQIDWGDVRIGQIDTGYTLHPAFGFPAQPWLDPAAARTFIADPPPGLGEDPLTGPSGGHGTRSASICSGFGEKDHFFGVAPKVPLVPARINDCTIIDQRPDEFEAAVRYLVDEAQVRVINVSMGTFLKASTPRAIKRAVDHAYDSGVILVAAAGNVPAPNWPAYPAAYPRAIAVAGITRAKVPWCGSSYGRWVDFSAPAKQVRRASTSKGPEYGYVDGGGGTTFAAAMTSGAAALWWVAHREVIRLRYPHAWQWVEAFRQMARRTALVPSHWNVDRGFGAGILNVAQLMDGTKLPAAGDLARR